ncbi:MAG: UDP-2,4-diacetamido-2,4,6-trideoxy-beta-L-altropyranose hydrolase [Verrucomicrobiota bacterium]
MSPLLIIRTDASPEIGTGHVMRCLAFAEIWLRNGGQAILAPRLLPEYFEARAQKMGLEVGRLTSPLGSLEDAAELIRLAKARAAAWIMVDGYQFYESYQDSLANAGLAVLWVDDFGSLNHYSASMVLNQSLGATRARYPRITASTRLLLGCRYLQLRREFLIWQHWQRNIPDTARRILITMGGSDPDNVALKALEGVIQTGLPLSATVIVGASSPNYQVLQNAVAGTSHRLVRNAENMPELMSQADLAITAGGTTAWELAYMGVPTLLITQADNQLLNCEVLDREGAAQNLGWHHLLSAQAIAQSLKNLTGNPVLRAAMSQAARKLVDGRGCLRVWLSLNETHFQFRPATAEDCALIHQWANAPEVRAVSFSSNPIPWETHTLWFERKLHDAACDLWIACGPDQKPAGQVRFERDGQIAVISVSLDAAARGQGRGSLLIWAGCRRLFQQRGETHIIHAYIKPENLASLRAFQNAGFGNVHKTVVQDQDAWRCDLTRESCME